MIRRRTAVFFSALTSLLFLGWWSFRPMPNELAQIKRITLWTAGATPDDPRVSAETSHVALPGATAPAGALRLADAAGLRRHLPALKHVEIRGNGVDATDAAALVPLSISWQRPLADPGRPTLVAVSTPLQVSTGQRLTVQGAITGLGPEGARLTLESPDGSLESIHVAGAEEGSAPFSITSLPTRTAGEFEWQLRLEPGGERLPLGVSVKAPPPPRVLVIQASPHPELARLLRWLTAANSPVTSRTRVSAERFRFMAAHGSVSDFALLDDAVLKSFDLVVTTESAVAELKADEQRAVVNAVRNTGLGLLVVGGPDSKAVDSPLLPWPLPATADAEEDRRLLRLQLADGTEIAEWTTLAAPELKVLPLTRKLVQDSSGRLLAAAIRDGHGWLARSVVLDAWRWEQAGHAEAFSLYWAGVVNAVARSLAADAGRWSLNAPNDPRFVHESIDLIWNGAANDIPLKAQAIFDEARERITLPVTTAALAPGMGRARYWPTSPGWHYVHSPGREGPALAFFVQGPDTLAGLRVARRHAATAALIDGAKQTAAKVGAGAEGPRAGWYSQIAYVAFAVFLTSMSVIWFHERRAS